MKNIKSSEFAVRGEYVELCQLLKLVGLADSGARGQQMVVENLAKVDGKPEHRKRAKIRPGQVVECLDRRITVTSEDH